VATADSPTPTSRHRATRESDDARRRRATIDASRAFVRRIESWSRARGDAHVRGIYPRPLIHDGRDATRRDRYGTAADGRRGRAGVDLNDDDGDGRTRALWREDVGDVGDARAETRREWWRLDARGAREKKE
jgi:hypothetical protein